MKSQRILLFVALLAIFIPFLAFAQGIKEVVAGAEPILLAVVLPVCNFIFTNFVKGKVGSESKSANWFIFAGVTAALLISYVQLGFPKINYLELLGSTGIVWGLVTAYKAQFGKQQ